MLCGHSFTLPDVNNYQSCTNIAIPVFVKPSLTFVAPIQILDRIRWNNWCCWRSLNVCGGLRLTGDCRAQHQGREQPVDSVGLLH